MIRVEQQRIKKIYGVKVMEAVGTLMRNMLTNIVFLANFEGVESAKLLKAFSEAIVSINRLANDYQEKLDKAPEN